MSAIAKSMSCGKAVYKSLKEAQRHVKGRWRVKKDFRAYLCRYCRFYHLTTSKEYGEE